jgi:hypothetical protein
MLPVSTVPPSLLGLLQVVRPCFTAPTFRTFAALVTGLIMQTRRRTVCGMLLGAGLTRIWPHDRAHYFFARARWSPDQLGVALAHLIAERLIPAGAALEMAVEAPSSTAGARRCTGRPGSTTAPLPEPRRRASATTGWWWACWCRCRSWPAPSACPCWPGCGGPRLRRARSTWPANWSACSWRPSPDGSSIWWGMRPTTARL